MALACPEERFRESSLERVLECVFPFLPSVDRATLRSVCGQLRKLANGTCSQLVLSSPPVFHALTSSQLLKRFPRVTSVEFMFASPLEVKAATMFILTSQPDQGARLARLAFIENRAAAQHLHQQQQSVGAQSSDYAQESRYQQYGYNSGARSTPPTFDFTESLLAAVCSCVAVQTVSVDKTVLLDTEAAALARLSGLQELRLATNSSAQPLRRPLLQIMLSSLTSLRILNLSYIRDTTADMATSLPRLPLLTKITFQYAYWGESGAGERIMAALAKYQKQLAELHLYESSVNDDMLGLIMGISTLRRLHIQDENAEEESCPTNKGLARITQLRRLEQLELFGEELQLDSELLPLLAQLPALRYLAMAGLDSLQPDDADFSTGANGVAFEELDAEVEELDLSSTMDGEEEETEESFSCVSLGGDEATSRPQRSLPATAATATSDAQDSVRTPNAARAIAAAAAVLRVPPGAFCARASSQTQQTQPQCSSSPQTVRASRTNAHTAPQGQVQSLQAQQHQQHHVPGPRGGGGAAPAVPMQVLRQLHTLRLYGPSSLCQSAPPLALLLPQPQLRQLKLSACASNANLRALAKQAGLQKLIVSHTSVPQLYPPPLPLPHGAASGLGQPPPCTASILGHHAEVLAGGLTSLRVLRIKDLPGLIDGHLADLAAVLAGLPHLTELKLRALGMVSDAGVAALAAVSQLQRLKLYALGDGVTEAGVAHIAASLPRLEELKVKDCRRVGPTLRFTVAALRATAGGGVGTSAPSSATSARAAAAGSGSSSAGGGGGGGRGAAGQLRPLVVRYGVAECDGGRKSKE